MDKEIDYSTLKPIQTIGDVRIYYFTDTGGLIENMYGKTAPAEVHILQSDIFLDTPKVLKISGSDSWYIHRAMYIANQYGYEAGVKATTDKIKDVLDV